MDLEHYHRGYDLGSEYKRSEEYIVYQTDSRNMWRYFVRRQSGHDVLYRLMRQNMLNDLLIDRRNKQRILTELINASFVTAFDGLERVFEVFEHIDMNLETLDSAQTTVLFCTHFEQVKRLLHDMDSLSKELRLGFDAIMNGAPAQTTALMM